MLCVVLVTGTVVCVGLVLLTGSKLGVVCLQVLLEFDSGQLFGCLGKVRFVDPGLGLFDDLDVVGR